MAKFHFLPLNRWKDLSSKIKMDNLFNKSKRWCVGKAAVCHSWSFVSVGTELYLGLSMKGTCSWCYTKQACMTHTPWPCPSHRGCAGTYACPHSFSCDGWEHAKLQTKPPQPAPPSLRRTWKWCHITSLQQVPLPLKRTRN